MAVYPKARYRPVEGHTDGPMSAHLGVVLHVNESNGNLYDFISNPATQVSCHFEAYKNGSLEQYLDTDTDSWCQRAGNGTYLSIETEGYTTEPLTDAQCATIAGVLAWAHTVHGIPLQLAEIPGQRGFGWHGMGAAHGIDWGHALCPGEIRRGQRAHILELAAGVLHPTPAKDPTVADEPTYRLYTQAGDKHGRVFASAPGVHAEVSAGDVDRLHRLGLVESKTVRRVQPVTMAMLKRINK